MLLAFGPASCDWDLPRIHPALGYAAICRRPGQVPSTVASLARRFLDPGMVHDVVAVDLPRTVEPTADIQRHRSGLVLGWLTTAPAVVVLAWLLVAVPLLLAGVYRPLTAVPLFVPVVALLLWGNARAVRVRPLPLWSLLATVAVALAFGALALYTQAEHVIPRRDPGVYAMIAHWLTTHSSVFIPLDSAAFGGPDQGLGWGNTAFFSRLDGIAEAPANGLVPQFMTGMPAVLAVGGWVAGWSGILVLPPVFGALSILAMGGLTARLVGPRWAPVGALALAVAFPVLHALRSTYSESLALLMTLAALYLLTELAEPVVSSWTAALAGLLVGVLLAVRIDTVREIVLLLPVLGWLAARRLVGDHGRAGRALPFGAGLALGTVYGIADGYLLSKPYFMALAPQWTTALWLGGAVLAAVVGVLLLVWRGFRLSAGASRRLTVVLPAAVAAVALFFVVRPAVQTVHDIADPHTRNLLAGLQAKNGLAVDGSRSYDELSAHWMAWYLGWPLLLVGLGGAAVLTYALLRGREQRWLLVFPVLLASVGITLLRPGITPDLPWATRRFVTVVIPALILVALWVFSRLVARAKTRGPRWRLLAVSGVLLFTLPAAAVAALPAGWRTERGQLAAVSTVCAAFGPRDVVLLADARAGTEWLPVLNTVCQVPTARLSPKAGPAEVARIAARVRATGHQPQLVSADDGTALRRLGVQPRRLVAFDATEAPHLLEAIPFRAERVWFKLWTAPSPSQP